MSWRCYQCDHINKEKELDCDSCGNARNKYAEEVSKYKSDVAKLNNKLSTIESRLTIANNKLEKLKKLNDESDQEIVELKKDNISIKNEKDKFYEKIKKLTDEKVSLCKTIDKLKSTRLENNDIISELKFKILEAEAKIVVLKKHNSDLIKNKVLKQFFFLTTIITIIVSLFYYFKVQEDLQTINYHKSNIIATLDNISKKFPVDILNIYFRNTNGNGDFIDSDTIIFNKSDIQQLKTFVNYNSCLPADTNIFLEFKLLYYDINYQKWNMVYNSQIWQGISGNYQKNINISCAWPDRYFSWNTGVYFVEIWFRENLLGKKNFYIF